MNVKKCIRTPMMEGEGRERERWRFRREIYQCDQKTITGLGKSNSVGSCFGESLDAGLKQATEHKSEVAGVQFPFPQIRYSLRWNRLYLFTQHIEKNRYVKQ